MRRPASLRLTLALGILTLVGCGSTTHGSPAQSHGGAGGAEPATRCPAGIPSAAELAVTPREFPNVELLALKFSDGVIADQAIYDRLVSDVKAIRQLAPNFANVDYFPPNDGRSVNLEVDATTFKSMQAGTYDAWSCLNDAYGAAKPSLLASGSLSYAFLKLRGIYDMDQVAAEYAALPGIMLAEADGGGDGPTICLTRAGDTWHYILDQASGDCPAGCTEHAYLHFSSSAAGDVTSLGVPSPAELQQYASKEACR